MDRSSALFSLGIISDIQYAMRKNKGMSYFRDSLVYLEEAIFCFNNREVDAVINLGDLVDSNEPEHLDPVMELLESSRSPVINILGNHDLIGRTGQKEILSRLHIQERWGERFRKGKWRVIAIDSTEISISSSASCQVLCREKLNELKRINDPCAEHWNGMASSSQMNEIESLLESATKEKNRVLIINHMVAASGSGSPRHRCWNHKSLTHLLDNSPCVAAHFNGHDHEGGFTTNKMSGTHYVTFPAICDSAGKTGAHAIAHFGEDWIKIEGWGRVDSRNLNCLAKNA